MDPFEEARRGKVGQVGLKPLKLNTYRGARSSMSSRHPTELGVLLNNGSTFGSILRTVEVETTIFSEHGSESEHEYPQA